MAGPLHSGYFAIIDAAGFALATVKIDAALLEECRALAHLFARSANRHVILQHVLTELIGDDEGARHEDLITMIQSELQQTTDYEPPASPDGPTAPAKSPADLVEGFKRLADEANR